MRCLGAQTGAPNSRLLRTKASYRFRLVQGIVQPYVPINSHILANVLAEHYLTLLIMYVLLGIVFICNPRYLKAVVVLKLY